MEPGERPEPMISMLVVLRSLCQDEDEIIHAPPPLNVLELPSVLMTQVWDRIAFLSGCKFVGRVRFSHNQCWVGHLFCRYKRKGCNGGIGGSG